MPSTIEISEATEIDAPPHAVWEALTDLPAFRAWNPFICRASGSTALGGTVHVRVRPSLPLRLPFRATIVERTEDRALRWQGHVGARWLAAGDHVFTLEPLAGNRTRFVQSEKFTGVLPRLAGKLLARETRRGFAAMNRALADRVALEAA